MAEDSIAPFIVGGPLGGFEPKRNVTIDTIKNFGKGAAAGTLGFPADIVHLISLFANRQPGGRPLDIPLTSDKLADRFGVNYKDPATMIGMIGAPDPGDVAKIAGKGLLAQALFHGTPHRFDKFDLKAIGTGEGAQAYGHGLYFAENPGVAKSYKSELSDFRFKVDGTEIDLSRESTNSPILAAAMDVADDGVDMSLRRARDGLRGGPADAESKEFLDTYIKQVEALRGSKVERMQGHLYEVDIPDETIGKMLDWDAPLSEQPELLKTLEGLGVDVADNPLMRAATPPLQVKGREAYSRLARQLGSEEAASRALNEAGIPGIRYYDNQSRFGGVGNFLGTSKVDGGYVSKIDVKGKQTTSPTFKTEGEALQWAQDQFQGSRTRNIVVFNPDDIREVKRDGELVYKTKGL